MSTHPNVFGFATQMERSQVLRRISQSQVSGEEKRYLRTYKPDDRLPFPWGNKLQDGMIVACELDKGQFDIRCHECGIIEPYTAAETYLRGVAWTPTVGCKSLSCPSGGSLMERAKFCREIALVCQHRVLQSLAPEHLCYEWGGSFGGGERIVEELEGFENFQAAVAALPPDPQGWWVRRIDPKAGFMIGNIGLARSPDHLFGNLRNCRITFNDEQVFVRDFLSWTGLSLEALVNKVVSSDNVVTDFSIYYV